MSVKVKVKFFAHLIEEVGTKEITIESVVATVPDVIEEIEKKMGINISSRLDDGYSILVNGRSYHLFFKDQELLKEGDVVAILPRLGGG